MRELLVGRSTSAGGSTARSSRPVMEESWTSPGGVHTSIILRQEETGRVSFCDHHL